MPVVMYPVISSSLMTLPLTGPSYLARLLAPISSPGVMSGMRSPAYGRRARWRDARGGRRGRGPRRRRRWRGRRSPTLLGSRPSHRLLSCEISVSHTEISWHNPGMIQRGDHLRRLIGLLREFPVVGLVGPRQVGKTTLARALARGWRGA